MTLKVIERGTNRKLVYELLLVVYSFNAENHIFAYPHLHLTLNLKVMQLVYEDKIWRQKTRIMGLPYCDSISLLLLNITTMRHNMISLQLKYNHGTTEYRGIFSRYLPRRKISDTAQHYSTARRCRRRPRDVGRPRDQLTGGLGTWRVATRHVVK